MLTPFAAQTALRQLGRYDGPADGDLRSDASISAVKKFQGDVGSLATDGVYGPKTDAALAPLANALAAPPPGFRQCRPWRLTSYYVAAEDGAGGGLVPVYDEGRHQIAQVSPGFFASMSLEGTGKLSDGRLLNVTGNYVPVLASDYAPVVLVAQANNWLPDRAGYAGIQVRDGRAIAALAFSQIADVGSGYGTAHGIALEPFRSLAGDIGAYPTSAPEWRGKGGLAPVGTRAWIPDWVGVLLPDGTRHDGWFLVHDTGGAIVGAHFDVFCGTRALYRDVVVRWPDRGHAWYEGLEDRVGIDYAYGL